MKRIAVIATRQIGDVLLTTPLIRAARLRWPQAEIDVIGFAGTLGMLQGNPDLHALVGTPARFGVRGLLAFIRRHWRHYDLALVTQPGDRAHLLAWVLARSRSGLVPLRNGSNWWKKALLQHAVVSAGDDSPEHVVREKLRLLDPWSAGGGPPVAVVPPPGRALPQDLQSALRADAVVVHTPSMWPYKQWPIEKFVELVRGLLDVGRQVVLTGSAGERDQACVAAVRRSVAGPGLLDASGRLDFTQLTTLLQGAALYIGPDTSVSHLAAACGVPVLAIFGPTNPQRWAPWPAAGEQPVAFQRRALRQQSGNVTLLQDDLACVPCSRAGCDDHLQSRSDCLLAITPQRVLATALELLERGR